MRCTDSAALRPLTLILLVLLRLGSGPPAAAADAVSPSVLEPAATGGVPAVERALARLTQHRRLLVVGAHPDDEDTTALTLAARGLGGEAAYLSLSRGEGGQNLIGPELGVDLGLLRSRELLAARRIDGARQLFTRAYDFGYTRSLEETLEHWPRELLLEDAVRAVRRFRPQVIVSVFPADSRGGHGQHQAAGVVAHEVFERAGEAGAFPELAEAGLEPWSPAA
ncbi:MAG: PIG-L family deacetylase, partial [Thermoanaerobaculia bacterium]